MQAVRQILDAEKLCQIVDIPEDMRYSQVEIIVLPVEVKVWKKNSASILTSDRHEFGKIENKELDLDFYWIR
ncbi:MAG: hypothetical protein LBH25_14625 [Fibromonadaceae bacterium]|jgi:hypothetical protein|nr:hypothetical protein [Fibromonadaceae bacterium]